MTSSAPISWTATGNDYRGIERLGPGPAPSVVVVVTGDPAGFESVARALSSSRYDGSIEVVPVEGIDLPVNADVVLLLDSAVSAEPDLVARHAYWHRRVANAVVIGSSQGDGLRGGVLRRSRRLLAGDEAFAAMSSSNISMRRGHWLRAFADDPVDEVAGWRLWNDGLTFVFEPGAAVSSEDRAGQPADQLHLADQIPHGRYRRFTSGLHAVPKVSWVVGAADQASADRAWQTCLRSSFADVEAVFWGPAAALESLAGLDTGTSRVTTVAGDFPETFARAVGACRGELLAILDPHATVPAEVLTKAVARYGAKPKASLVRAGYSVGGDRYLRFDDIAAIDDEIDGSGLPHFALVSRRELVKEAGLADDPGAAWRSVVARCSPALVISPLVEIGGPVSVRPRLPGVSELPTVGLEELARTVVRARRRRSEAGSPSEADGPASDDDRVSVAYVGFTGQDNLGDEAVLLAIERLMPWAVFDPDPVDPELLMVGGGTLINGRKYYLTRLLRQESAVVERALFGTGVRNPGFWGVTEPMEDWFSFIDSALVAGVRGPDSVRNLRELGYHSDVPIIGDPALSLRPSDDITRVEGRVVVCPVHTGGNLHGGDDDAVFDSLATLIGKLRSEGRDVVMMTAYPPDDRWAIDIMDRAGARDMTYVAGYDDIDVTMDLLASADLVVGERLHAIILAAAAGTAFVGLEYRPKLRDFAKSVGQDRAVIRTDEMDRLDDVVTRVLGDRAAIVGSTSEKVDEFRQKQEQLAAELRSRLDALRG